MLPINTFLGPKHRMTFPTAIAWKNMLSMPKTAKRRPIVYGVKPRPPFFRDVDHMSGVSAATDISQRPRKPQFMTVINTVGMRRRARRVGGLAAPGLCSDSDNEPLQSCVVSVEW